MFHLEHTNLVRIILYLGRSIFIAEQKITTGILLLSVGQRGGKEGEGERGTGTGGGGWACFIYIARVGHLILHASLSRCNSPLFIPDTPSINTW